MSLPQFDSLNANQKQCAEIMVQNAVDRRTNKQTTKKLTQKEIGELLDPPVTDRQIRNWNKNPTFLAYVEYLSLLRVRQAMPDFVGVLVANLEHGQNLSTKQLDLIARVAQWLPEQGAPKQQQVGSGSQLDDVQARIAKLERKEIDAIVLDVEDKKWALH